MKQPTPEDIEQLKGFGYDVKLEDHWVVTLDELELSGGQYETEPTAWLAAAEHRDLTELIEDARRGIGEAEGSHSYGEIENTKFHLEHVADVLADAVKRKPLPSEWVLNTRAQDGLEISATGASLDAILEGIGFVRKADRDEPSMRKELAAHIATLTVTSDNIGAIRSRLIMPFSCKWNGWVRDLTAERENREAEAVK